MQGHEASRGLSATAELLVGRPYIDAVTDHVRPSKLPCSVTSQPAPGGVETVRFLSTDVDGCTTSHARLNSLHDRQTARMQCRLSVLHVARFPFSSLSTG